MILLHANGNCLSMLELITWWKDHSNTNSVMQLPFDPPLSPRTCPCERSCVKLPHDVNIGPTPNDMPSQNMFTSAILIWPGLPVALGAAFWAVD